MPRTVGLRTEIVFNLALLLGAALLFGGMVLLRWTERSWVLQETAAARGGVEVVAAALESSWPEDGTPRQAIASRADRLLDSLPPDFALSRWILLDGGLERMASSSEETRPLDPGAAGRALRGGETEIRVDYPSSLLPWTGSAPSGVTVSAPLQRGGDRQGVLQARFSLDAVRRRTLDTLGLVLLFAGGYGTVLVIFGSYLLHRNVVRPVRQLRQVTRRVAEGDLEPVILVEGPREIASLAEDFNTMTAALGRSREETREQIRRLEEANADLRRIRSELLRSERMASVGHLAAGMAHEIGNPLGAVTGYLELLKGRPPGDPRRRDLLERSQLELERIEQLVRDLLDFAAPGIAEPSPVDPAARLREAASLLEHQGAFRDVRVEDRLPEGLPTTRIVSHRLTQVFVNLLLNARDASPEGSTVTLSGSADGPWIRLAVTDRGEGVPPERLEHIFDPFYTTKAPGEGRGLGLSVCHRILDEAGGRIEVRSAPGSGSTFTVLLRRVDGDA